MSLHFMNSYVHYRINTLVMIPIRTRCERSAGERGTGAERLRCFPHPVLAGRWAEEWLVHVKTTDRRWMRLKESSSSVTDWHAEENERIRQALVSQWSPSPRNTGNMKSSRSTADHMIFWVPTLVKSNLTLQHNPYALREKRKRSRWNHASFSQIKQWGYKAERFNKSLFCTPKIQEE